MRSRPLTRPGMLTTTATTVHERHFGSYRYYPSMYKYSEGVVEVHKPALYQLTYPAQEMPVGRAPVCEPQQEVDTLYASKCNKLCILYLYQCYNTLSLPVLLCLAKTSALNISLSLKSELVREYESSNRDVSTLNAFFFTTDSVPH